MPEIRIVMLLLEVNSFHPVLSGVLYSSLNSLLWFFGVHGYYALLPLLEAINLASTESGSLVNDSFLGAFVFIGGSGATLSLILALLLFGKSSHLRILALAAIPIACINVNELLLFGLPIILNYRLLIPFFCTPVIHTLVSYTVISLGWLAPATGQIPFNSPILINAYLAMNGDWRAVVLQVVNILIGTLVYAFFIHKLEFNRNSGIYFPSFETIFSQRTEEASVLLDDPIGKAYQAERERQSMQIRLKQLSQYEFFLQYQPVVNTVTGRVTSCESLLRARDSSGAIAYPNSFLPAFEQAALMKTIDLWVLRSVAAQIEQWAEDDFDAPMVTVNITAESLYSRTQVQEMASIIAKHPRKISLEITERTLAGDPKLVNGALSTLRVNGAAIYIDDFGTDYSSLSYLHKYPVDVIKLDRGFVVALDHERGCQVFHGIIALAGHLGFPVVVEGVQTLEQLKAIPKKDSITIQGWYFSQALSPDDFRSFVERNRAEQSLAHLSAHQ